MSSLQTYYTAVTKQMLSSQFIVSSQKHVYSLNKGTFTFENPKPSLVQILTYMLVVRKKPSVLRSLTPSNVAVSLEKSDENDKRQSTFKPKRVAIFNHLSNIYFGLALKKWSAIDRHWPNKRKKHEKKVIFTRRYVKVINWQMPFFNKLDKNEDFNPIHKIPQRASIGVSFRINKGTLSTRLFIINMLKLLKK